MAGRADNARAVATALCLVVAAVASAGSAAGAEIPFADSLGDARDAAWVSGRPIARVLAAVGWPVFARST